MIVYMTAGDIGRILLAVVSEARLIARGVILLNAFSIVHIRILGAVTLAVFLPGLLLFLSSGSFYHLMSLIFSISMLFCARSIQHVCEAYKSYRSTGRLPSVQADLKKRK